MFQSILIGVSLVVIASIGYVLLKAWGKSAGRREMFQATLAPATMAPAAAPAVEMTASAEPPRVIAPAGPNPPNARPESKRVSFSPEAAPTDPFDEVNGETPMQDSLRHPERSFGPGIENTGAQRGVESGVSAATVQSGTSVFSPDFAQNGGEFMKGIGANDAWGSDTYATA